MDLALETYTEQKHDEGSHKSNPKTTQGLDVVFKRSAIDNIKTFLFAGHDTTSSTQSYIYHLFSQHPEALKKVQEEHDEVFGTEPDQAATMIKKDPRLLNRLGFPSPDAFHPERFLPPNTVPEGAWRPFERGPRNCIGQELALLEMKIIMMLTLRKFTITAAYDEYDRMKGRKKEGTVREAFGERAYQTLIASANPSDGMPARVRKIENW
ncbi:MAG: hypothetical protein M1812_002243 [Candelaria pacifica]|nr:MAG: hypothetical protein M1812_002243 [Candelaria pacifica]